ncbi:MAG: class I SAM-dependent methyltransferase [Lentisphaeria bacterium]|nr:MAG: class I SAM-dependent methyltransferase [Lentisphaeria bacterium]
MFSPRKNAEIRTRRSSDCASPISSVATCSSPTICTTASGRTICRSPSQTCRKHRSFTRSFCEKNIPGSVSNILDVGCGTGHNAELLLACGYQVDCVSPSPYLSSVTRKKLRERSKLYECTFEELPPGRKYDCLLFSESFQYIDLDTVFLRMPEFLNPGGYVVISDFFRIPGEGSSAMGGGHRLSRFREKTRGIAVPPADGEGHHRKHRTQSPVGR